MALKMDTQDRNG